MRDSTILKVIHGSQYAEETEPQKVEIRTILRFIYGVSALCVLAIAMIAIELILY